MALNEFVQQLVCLQASQQTDSSSKESAHATESHCAPGVGVAEIPVFHDQAVSKMKAGINDISDVAARVGKRVIVYEIHASLLLIRMNNLERGSDIGGFADH